MQPGDVLDDRFEIVRVAGAGGAGVVHEGIDRQTGGRVAIKTAQATSGDSGRFAREIAILATLRHPAIVSYLGHGTIDGRAYLVMEWLAGEDLAARLQSARLPVSEALDIGRQLAGALAAAHEKGLVHRDVKPSNVVLVAGRTDQIKLLDFGLARRAGLASLTVTGALIGTPSYMAPEQARGDRELDARVDVYGLGALLFHCIAGRPPFEGETLEQVIMRIVGEPAPPLRALVADVAPAIDALVARMLSKDPLRRPADGRAAHVALVGQDAAPSEPAAHAPWDASITLEAPAAAGVAPPPASSIAVLAFLDMSPERDQGYLCDGIADELIDALGNVAGLRVAARISSFWFKSAAVDAREIGRRLGVDAILEGGVRLAGNRLRVTVRVIDVATGHQRWSHRFDGTLDDVFAIQDDIAARAVEALRGLPSSREHDAIRRPGADVEAYRCFLRARQLLYEVSPASYQLAVEMLERAIELDPNYAPAYAGLAEMHCRYFEWSYGDADVRAAAERASLRALELAPHLPEAHIARGQVLKIFERYPEAEQAFEAALRLHPTSFDAHHLFGRLRFATGDIEGSVALFRRAAEIRREDYQTPLMLAQSLRKLGRIAEADAARDEGTERVERQLALWPNDARALALGAAELVHGGDRDRALAWAERAAAAAPDDPGVWYNVACTYAGLRMTDEALAWLAKTFTLRMGARAWVAQDPDFDFVRDDPRFQALFGKLS